MKPAKPSSITATLLAPKNSLQRARNGCGSVTIPRNPEQESVTVSELSFSILSNTARNDSSGGSPANLPRVELIKVSPELMRLPD